MNVINILWRIIGWVFIIASLVMLLFTLAVFSRSGAFAGIIFGLLFFALPFYIGKKLIEKSLIAGSTPDDEYKTQAIPNYSLPIFSKNRFDNVTHFKNLKPSDWRIAPMGRQISTAAISILAFMLVWGCFYTVKAGERAIVLRFGQITSVESDGLHFKAPFIDSVVLVDVRTKKAHAPANAGTRDLQTVTTEVALNYHLQADQLKDTYTRVGLDVEEKVIDPRIQEIVKAVTAKFSAEELLSRREDVKMEIASGLRDSLIAYNIVVEDIQITNFSFSRAFDAAIEAKQTAEQQALKAKNDLDRIRVEAQQKITMAEAEAKTIQIQAQAIKQQGGDAYVQLKAIEKWDGRLPMVSGSSTPFINLTDFPSAGKK